jgi:hypothetical protein
MHPTKASCRLHVLKSAHRPRALLDASMVLLNGLITNDKFCFARTSPVKLNWARRSRRDSAQAVMLEKRYLPKTLRLWGGPYEAAVANPPSFSASRRRSAALGPGLSTPTGVGTGVPRKQRSAPRDHASPTQEEEEHE